MISENLICEFLEPLNMRYNTWNPKISTKIAAKSDRKNVDLTAVSLDWTIFQPSKTDK